MSIKTILQLLFVIVLIISGVQTSDYRILEDLAFTNASSYDLVEVEEGGQTKKKLEVVNSIPEADPKAKLSREALEAVANTSKEARAIMARQTDRILVSGQLRTVLFGLELAKAGVWKHMDTLVRDPSIGQRVRIAVVDGNAAELLKQDYGAFPDTGTFIFELLSKEIGRNVIPDVNIYHFTRDYFDDGSDPIAPVLKRGDQAISVEGIALFQKDRYVGQITSEQALVFAFLRNDIRDGDLNAKLGDEEYALLSSIDSNRKVRIKRLGDSDSFTAIIELKILGSMLEYIGTKQLSNDSDLQQVQRQIEDYIVAESEILMKQVQSLGSDCIGIGGNVRSSLSAAEWYGMDWKSVYPTVEIKVHAEVKIKNIGKFQ